MPVFARACFNDVVALGLADEAFAHDFVFQHQRLDVASDDDIAAAAENKFLARGPVWLPQHGPHIVGAFDAQELRRPRADAKAVEALQGRIAFKNEILRYHSRDLIHV